MIVPINHIKEGLTLTINPIAENYTCEERLDAHEFGESRYQIGEGQFYQYEFSSEDFYFQKSDYLEPFKGKEHLGRISPNIYVGTLTLNVFNKASTSECGVIEIEVQSQKTTYRSDYRTMLEEITEHCFDLILQLNVPIKQNLIIDFGSDSQTDLQRFAFIKSIIDSDTFHESIQRIISSPTTKWSEEFEAVDLRKVNRVNQSILRQIVKSNNRSPLPDSHGLRVLGFNSVPHRVESKLKTDSLDTSENRFIKHALETFLHFIMEFERSVPSKSREKKEAKALVATLEEYIDHSLFRSVSRPTTLKLNSPVLQRKEGYREILRSWILFDLAAKLTWQGGEDVYKAGKKDIATLYEYWLFFKLLKLFGKIFRVEPTSLGQLIIPTADGLGLQLKQGRHVALNGTYESASRMLNIRFSYNRSFSGSNDYPKGGSWTKSMRPDYTLSIWPTDLKEDQAEVEEVITHIHFDAKYKVESFLKLVEDDNLDDEKEDHKKGKYKNADLLKMHAYRDAIRRTSGAYVLYPGGEVYHKSGFHEILPGLGAFPIRPSVTNSGVQELEKFILTVIDNLTNRISQREHFEQKRYLIHKDKPSDGLHEPLPEYLGTSKLHPDETFVLVGYFKGIEHLEWISNRGLYNARMNSDRGSLKIQKELLNAKYLLLHGDGDQYSSRLFNLSVENPKVFTTDALIELGYPSQNPSGKSYLVFKVEPSDTSLFGNAKWDFRQLEGYMPGRGSGFPFVVSLTDLLRTKVNSY